jgi:hypothetical protein
LDRILPDFSDAGFSLNKKVYSSFAEPLNIKTLGAKGDGITDDTLAISKALERAVPGVVLYFPKGTYVLTKPLVIEKSRVIFRGESMNSTRLYFPKTLGESKGPHSVYWEGSSAEWPTNFYALSDAFIEIKTKNPIHGAGIKIKGNFKKGDFKVQVEGRSNLKKGDWIAIRQSDLASLPIEESLPAHFAGRVTSDLSQVLRGPAVDEAKVVDAGAFRARHPDYPIPKDAKVSAYSMSGSDSIYINRVKQVQSGWIVLQKPLEEKVDSKWSPAIYRLSNRASQVGFEQLTVVFPERPPHTEHNTEEGYNAFRFENAHHNWLKNVRIENSDNAIIAIRSHHNIFEGVEVDSKRAANSTGMRGHHGIFLRDNSQNNLISGLLFKVPLIHDVSLSHYSSWNVFSKMAGAALNVDFHAYCSHSNLFTELHVGSANSERFWKKAEGPAAYPYECKQNVFWSVQGDQNQSLDFNATAKNHSLDFIMTGFPGLSAETRNQILWADESSSAKPVNLYEAQRGGKAF